VTRRGFTLLEVMVAVVLTSVVALAAYAAARVSAEAQARVVTDLRSVRSERAARQTVLDLLHNVRLPRQRGDTAFMLRNDTLSFVAAGAPPLDPDYDWLVTLRSGGDRFELTAVSLGGTERARVGFRWPGVSGGAVRVLAPGGATWMREWPQATVVPRAVSITFTGVSGAGPPPLHAVLAHQPPLGHAEQQEWEGP
jgi:prepilin-type N-terminal cleavage/methylation domain-containing protein